MFKDLRLAFCIRGIVVVGWQINAHDPWVAKDACFLPRGAKGLAGNVIIIVIMIRGCSIIDLGHVGTIEKGTTTLGLQFRHATLMGMMNAAAVIVGLAFSNLVVE